MYAPPVPTRSRRTTGRTEPGEEPRACRLALEVDTPGRDLLGIRIGTDVATFAMADTGDAASRSIVGDVAQVDALGAGPLTRGAVEALSHVEITTACSKSHLGHVAVITSRPPCSVTSGHRKLILIASVSHTPHV